LQPAVYSKHFSGNPKLGTMAREVLLNFTIC
jgi:hypothetical protein